VRHAGLAVALAVTVSLGLYLRWVLTGRVGLVGDFAHLRHAHSHTGYYAVLFPLAWAAWRGRGAPAPGPRARVVYGMAVGVAFFGFVRAGYGPEAIAASTVLGALWLSSAWDLRHRMRDLSDPLGAVPLSLVGALACVPPIAMNLRTQPEVAHGFVATFLAGLLFGVVVPSALARDAADTAAPWPLLLGAGALGALSLGAWPSIVTRAGLAVYALVVGLTVLRGGLRWHQQLAWTAVCLGLLAMAVGLLPNTRPVALGAIHFLVLGPALGTLVPPLLRRGVPDVAWLAGYGAAAALAIPLVAQGLGAGMWTLDASAVGGSLVVVWWAGCGLWQLARDPG